MKRIMMVAALVAVMTAALAGVAYAKVFNGTAGHDRLIGTAQKDVISGLRGPDFINGRGAADELYGGKGNDEIHGKCGSDYISGGRGFDVLRGGAGNDRIEAADGKHDFINCGPGDADRVSADREAEGAEDRVKNCEYINGQLLEKPPVVEPPAEESQAQE